MLHSIARLADAAKSDAAGVALVDLGLRLKKLGYSFHTPTPETHRRVLARASSANANTLTDVFGWNKSFAPEILPPDIFRLLRTADKIEPAMAGKWKSTIRFSTLDTQLLAHSGFPTSAEDAVFFGPDTYRFARAIDDLAHRYPQFRPQSILDIGTGSGAGGLHCATLYPDAEILLSDINPAALYLAQANAVINHARNIGLIESDLFARIDGAFDLIIANPPYMVDPSERTYRHGGGQWGCAFAERIVRESLTRLTPGGKLLLYTGTPVVGGVDQFFETVRSLLNIGNGFQYEEIDPDVFGEELVNPPYTEADRIAAVMLIVDSDVRP